MRQLWVRQTKAISCQGVSFVTHLAPLLHSYDHLVQFPDDFTEDILPMEPREIE